MATIHSLTQALPHFFIPSTTLLRLSSFILCIFHLYRGQVTISSYLLHFCPALTALPLPSFSYIHLFFSLVSWADLALQFVHIFSRFFSNISSCPTRRRNKGIVRRDVQSPRANDVFVHRSRPKFITTKICFFFFFFFL